MLGKPHKKDQTPDAPTPPEVIPGFLVKRAQSVPGARGVMDTREHWLTEMIALQRDHFARHGHTVPSNIRVSCGLPSRGAFSRSQEVVGECWPLQCNKDGHFEIFISPVLDDPKAIAHIITHELVHVVDECKHGHRVPFKRIATAVGLTGKMTSTVPTPELATSLEEFVEELGSYPHGALTVERPHKKQSTRNLKVTCAICGYIARITRYWLDAVGPPICAQCQIQMKEAV